MYGSINATLKCFSLPVLGSKYLFIILERDVFMVIKFEETKVADDAIIEGFDKVQLPNNTRSILAYFKDDNGKKFCLTVGAFQLEGKEYYGFGVATKDGEKYAIKDLDNERIPIFCADNADEKQKKNFEVKMKNAIMRSVRSVKFKSADFQEFLNDLKKLCENIFKSELKGLVKMNYDFKFAQGTLLKAKVPIVYRNEKAYMPGTIFEVVKCYDYGKKIVDDVHQTTFSQVGWDKGLKLKVHGNEKKTADIQVECAVVYALFDLYDEAIGNIVTVENGKIVVKDERGEVVEVVSE